MPTASATNKRKNLLYGNDTVAPATGQAGGELPLAGEERTTSTQATRNVGNQGNGATSATSPSTASVGQNTGSSYNYPMGEFDYNEYMDSITDVVGEAPKLRGEYDAEIDAIFEKIMNREKFSYDYNEDAIYDQYKDSYTRGGKLASQDAQAQAAALTGGYSNSYAQTAGQQVFNQYMQDLSAIIPELEERAYARYSAEGDELYNRYSLLANERNTEYSRHRDDLADWWQQVALYNDRADTEYSKQIEERNWQHQLDREEVEDAWRQQEWDYAVDQDTFNRLLELGDYEGLKNMGYNTAELEAVRDLEMQAAQLGINNQRLEQYLAVGDYDALEAMGFDVTALETARNRETELYNMEVSKAQQQQKLDMVEYAMATGDFSKLTEDKGWSTETVQGLKTQYNNNVAASDYAAWQLKVDKAIATGDKVTLSECGFSDEDIEAILNPMEETEDEFTAYSFTGYDDDGNALFWDPDSKKQIAVPKGFNPYNGKRNDDIDFGTFDSGYQPNNIDGDPLHKTGRKDEINGYEVYLWYLDDGSVWIWDGKEKNGYIRYLDENDSPLYFFPDENGGPGTFKSEDELMSPIVDAFKTGISTFPIFGGLIN